MGLIFANNAKSTLATGIDDNDLSMTLASGATFPTFGVGDYAYITISNTANTTFEIVKVTGKSGNVLTIDAAGRGLDGTAAATWASGSLVQLRIPKITAEELFTAGGQLATYATNASNSASAAATSASNASTSASNAATSASNAATSEGNAATSETNAAASAAAAAATLASALWRDVVFVTSADSPITIAQADNSKLYVCDTTSGNIVVNLPAVSGLTLPFTLGVKKESGDANTVTINRGGSDQIDGATSKSIATVGGTQLLADTSPNPDEWTGIDFGASGGNMSDDVFTDGVGFTAGVSTSVTLSNSYASETNIWVFFDGVQQGSDTYSLSGTTLTFDAAIPSGVSKVYVKGGSVLAIGVPGDGTVTAAKLASDAVTTAKILDANVTAAKLATDAVETAKIKDLNVTTGKLADNAVTTAKLATVNQPGVQTIWIPAGAMTARTTNGAGSGTAETSTNKVMIKTLDFDQTTSEYAQFTVPFPNSWNLGTVTAQFYWSAASGSGTVTWALQGVAISDDDVLDTAFGTAQTVTDTLIATTDQHISAATSAITIAGTPADGDLTYFQVYRDIADTLNADARLHGVKLFYTTDAANDA